MLHVPYIIYPSIGQGSQLRFPSSSAKNCTTTPGKLGYYYTSATHVLLLLGAVCWSESRGDGYDEVDTPAHDSSNQVVEAILFRTLPRLKMPDRTAKCEMRQRDATAKCDREKATKRKIPKRPSVTFRLSTSLNSKVHTYYARSRSFHPPPNRCSILHFLSYRLGQQPVFYPPHNFVRLFCQTERQDLSHVSARVLAESYHVPYRVW